MSRRQYTTERKRASEPESWHPARYLWPEQFWVGETVDRLIDEARDNGIEPVEVVICMAVRSAASRPDSEPEVLAHACVTPRRFRPEWFRDAMVEGITGALADAEKRADPFG